MKQIDAKLSDASLIQQRALPLYILWIWSPVEICGYHLKKNRQRSIDLAKGLKLKDLTLK